MIITVKSPGSGPNSRRWRYNAPNTIRVGDRVELPPGASGRNWIGEVTQAAGGETDLRASGYAGPIKAIVGKVEPQQVTVTADTTRQLIAALRRQADDLEDDLDLGNWWDD